LLRNPSENNKDMCPLDVPLILLKGYPLLGEDMYIYIYISLLLGNISQLIYMYIYTYLPQVVDIPLGK